VVNQGTDSDDWLFGNNRPYAVTVLSTDPITAPPGQGPGAGLGGAVRTLELVVGMGAITTNVGGEVIVVEDPFIFHPNAQDPSQVMSMLSPRVFADWINGDIDWNPATNTVTLSGVASNGVHTEVVMTVGSNRAYINGEGHDIATFAARYGHTSGPAGSVEMINTGVRTYVPLRFLTNAFGRNVSTVNWPTVVIS